MVKVITVRKIYGRLQWLQHARGRREWREVLQACRYDPDEVYIEDAKRIFQYFHLHEVKCTAVDIEELDIPSTKGLTKGISLMSCGSTR